MSLLDELFAHWEFQHHPVLGSGTQNNLVRDKAGAGNDLQPFNFTFESPGVTPGRVGNGFLLDGGSQFFRLNSVAGISHQGNAFTVHLWYQPVTLSDGAFLAVCNEWQIETFDDGGTFRFRVTIDGKALVATKTAVVPGDWYSLRFGYEAPHREPAKIFFAVNMRDGAYEVRDSISPLLGQLTIGGSGTNGIVDEWSIWRRSLTREENFKLYNSGEGIPLSEFADPKPFKSIRCCR